MNRGNEAATSAMVFESCTRAGPMCPGSSISLAQFRRPHGALTALCEISASARRCIIIGSERASRARGCRQVARLAVHSSFCETNPILLGPSAQRSEHERAAAACSLQVRRKSHHSQIGVAPLIACGGQRQGPNAPANERQYTIGALWAQEARALRNVM